MIKSSERISTLLNITGKWVNFLRTTLTTGSISRDQVPEKPIDLNNNLFNKCKEKMPFSSLQSIS